MTSHVEDEENPALKTTKFFVFKNPDPGFTQTVISVFANVVFSHCLLYGVTGNPRAAFLASMFTAPLSAWMCSRDSQRDYDKWVEMRQLRLKGVPDKFLPYRCKYDWTDYEITKIRKTIVDN
ncbi:hypothetical protein PENTCL1PPCAC_25805 [Pristionchus entomophagus]|uniref:Uncharacterized protein n=1 Tax=Pristionchus entomophagus TaxID=358040 RepID=A0AAV5U9S3_9BILA|nr:hypothetical protein PENTCL1PPCAC_25805 [Pristionchus entomophagus]